MGKGYDVDRQYLFEYAADDGKRLRQMTLKRFAGNSLSNISILSDPKYPRLSPWLSVSNDTIFNIWGESDDEAGNTIWVKQDIEEFYGKCLRYREKHKIVSSGEKDPEVE